MTKRFAIIENNVVVNTALADAPFAESWVEIAQGVDAGIGWGYSGGVFTAPAVPTTSAAPRHISPLAYMNRFTDSELATIYTAAKTVVAVEVWLAKFNRAQYIDLDDASTIAGLNAMESAGLIGSGRASAILA